MSEKKRKEFFFSARKKEKVIFTFNALLLKEKKKERAESLLSFSSLSNQSDAPTNSASARCGQSGAGEFRLHP